MKTSKNDLEWGLKAEIPEDAQAAWGARAIQQYDKLDLLPDRQDSFAVNESMKAGFWAAWGRAGMLGVIRDAYSKLWQAGKFRHDQAETVRIYEDNALVTVGNTNGSHGYVYLAVYLKPHRASEKLPAPGESVYVAVNDIGEATVIRHDEEHGYPVAVVIPTDPPRWYRKQNRLETSFKDNIWSVCGICPNDIARPEDIEKLKAWRIEVEIAETIRELAYEGKRVRLELNDSTEIVGYIEVPWGSKAVLVRTTKSAKKEREVPFENIKRISYTTKRDNYAVVWKAAA